MPEAWTLTIKNLFLPIFCRQCRFQLLTQENGYFCPECWNLPDRIKLPFCTVCGHPHEDSVGFGPLKNFLCAKCRLLEPPPYRRVFGAAAYDGAISQAIKICKFNDRPAIANLLAEVMVEFAQREINCEQYHDLVPVPLHRVHQRDRGFNQAQLLAKKLLPTFPRSRLNETLLRIRPTRRQVTLKDSKERRENVVGAFAVRPEEHFDGRTVLLIDDIVTSGGTAAECARALKRAGAKHVDVFAAALPTDDWTGSLKDRHREEPRTIWPRLVAR